MENIHSQYLSFDFIRNKAEEFRNQYVKPPDKIPVPIIEIVEFQLGITPIPVPNLQKSIDVDGFLSNNFKYIYIDQDRYIDDRYINRIRFTFAHEVGHLILHKNEIGKCKFRNEDEWIHFREEMSEDDLSKFEYQAYEFAGRLLVPLNKLNEELNNIRDKIDQYRSVFVENSSDLLYEAVSKIICNKFEVSYSVILRRLKNERIIL